jgi:hypothetical protein
VDESPRNRIEQGLIVDRLAKVSGRPRLLGRIARLLRIMRRDVTKITGRR